MRMYRVLFILLCLFIAYGLAMNRQVEDALAQDVTEHVFTLAWRSDNRVVALGTDQGNIEFFDTVDLQIIHRISITKEPVRHIAWNPSGEYLAIAESNGIVKILDYNLKDIQSILPTINSSPIYQIAWSPVDNHVLIAYENGNPNLIVWDFEQEEYTLGADVRGVSEIQWNSENELLAVSYTLPHIHLFDSKTYEDRGFLGFSIEEMRQQLLNEGIDNIITEMAWSNDGAFLVSGSNDGLVTLWDIEEREDIFTFDAPQSENMYTPLRLVEDVWFSEDGDRFISIARDGTLRSWQTETGEMTVDFQIASATYWATVSPDQTKIFYLDEQNNMYVVNIYEIVLDQFTTRVGDCVSDQALREQLNELAGANVNELAAEIVANRDDFTSATCADELLGLAEVLQDTPER